MRVAEWRAKFAALNPRPIDLGLDRMREALACLGNPEQKPKSIIHVSGTNGKGGVVACLEAALMQAGMSTQAYTSPFLWNFEENVRYQGQAIDPKVCSDLFERLWDSCHHIPLTWFEADTLVAFLAFEAWGADVTLLECGMGGASDATAVVPAPLAAILTNVGGDHAEFLGSDLVQVAREKAGIAKGAPLYVPKDFEFEVGPVHPVPVQDQHPSLALANAVLADHFPGVSALKAMPPQTGRWHRDPANPQLIYDVGHNAHAAKFLAQRLAREAGPYRLDLGMLTRKDPHAFLEAFKSLPLFLHPVDLGDEGHSPAVLTEVAKRLNMSPWEGQPFATRLITGSHNTVAKFLTPGA